MAWGMKINVLIILFISFLCVCSGFLKKGPYKTKLTECRECKGQRELTDSFPLDKKDPFLKVQCEPHNTNTRSYHKGNYTFLRAVSNIQVRIRSFFYEDDQWRMRLLIPRLTDNRRIFGIVVKAVGANYDENNHTMRKSGLKKLKLDVNMVNHAWESEKTYGRWMWVFQIISGQKSTNCLTIFTDVIPDLT